jgi:hypothetical protein
MAMKCRYCGTENPDYAVYCGWCGESLEDKPVSTVGEELPHSLDRTEEAAPSSGTKSLGVFSLSLASITLTISLFLTSLGCVLYIYYYERWLKIIHGGSQTQIDLIQSLSDVIKVANYSSWFGDVALILGFVFIVQALTSQRLRVKLMTGISDMRLVGAKWMLIFAAVLITLFVLFYIAQSELKVDLDYAISLRLQYLRMIAWPFVVAAFLTLVFALRKEELIDK